ncbi:CoA pyrophosphatase [Sphingomonas rubra]|uniref:NUDIX domain-containing protein n=1 Tax=Sphingomonas rubra TaxID=634430 RepID=A0A1I5U0X9_9SPHN|nr:CoA pyrophosphatase [Sphingomonas rubra]SFP88943.1 NUDIX domain-containing protein [Sphingomonas rubra]
MRLADRLRAALTEDHGAALVGGDLAELVDRPADDMMAAAVLIAVTDRPEPGVILTQRTDTLRHHPGQIAFPGGRVEPGEDAVAAALREAEEEIALPPAAVEIVGPVDRYRTVTGFDVVPVIGVVPPDLTLVPAEAEVASVFEVPLAFVLNAGNHRAGSGYWRGAERRFVEIPWQERRIWGATAAIIVNLSRRLRWA